MKTLDYQKTLWNISFILIGFIFVNHFFCTITFLTNEIFLPFVFPLSLLLILFISIYIGKRNEFDLKNQIYSIVFSLIIIFISLLFSSLLFDFSWDGQWYHQAAIYNIKDGWNPFFEPIKKFNENNDISIIHFPKGPWYFAASVYSTFGDFEAGKTINFIVIAAAFTVLLASLSEFGFSLLKSLIISSLIVFNPVVWSEVTTFLVDGLLILYLTIYLATLCSWVKKPQTLSVIIGMMASICLINSKFTGLVFFCVFATFAFIYFLIAKKEYLFKFIGIHAFTLILGVCVFGFNPYVTNTIERGNPLYPIMGSAKYPSCFAQGFDANEVYETPQNMQGKSLFTRFFFAHFGRPGNAPYNNENKAELIWPFTSNVSDWKAYTFHETRVSGFGPFFSGILIISFVLMLWVIASNKKSFKVLSLLLLGIISTLLISKHFWWPRFAPQIWLIPLLPIIFSLWYDNSKIRSIYTWILISIVLVNGLIVMTVHLNWEIKSSINLKKQLTEINHEKKIIYVNSGWFEKSTNERLNKWGINYKNMPADSIFKNNPQVLTSVVEGYPGAVIFSEID